MKIFDYILSVVVRFLPSAFDPNNMNRIHGGTGGLWLYKSADSVATIIASGYFNSFTNQLQQGDQILISGGIGGTVARDSAVVSSANNAATVTVAVKT